MAMEESVKLRWKDIGVIVIAEAAMLLAACWHPNDLYGDKDRKSILSSLTEPCESFGCGGNANIDGEIFHELSVDGWPNEEGFELLGFTSGQGAAGRLPIGRSMVVHVQNDMLFGLVDGQAPVGGQELVGAKFTLRNAETQLWQDIIVDEVSDMEFWIGAAGQPARTLAYKLRYDVSGRESRTGWACSDTPLSGNMALIFEGDRYDHEVITVAIPGESEWFNVACVGSALAKLHLLRHTSAGSGSPNSPSREQRQALLKLLSADYCGDGRAYARSGTPLFFRDQEGRFDPTPWLGDRIAESEAIWTATGALCLDDPRRPDPTQPYAEIRAELVSACENSPVESRRRTIPRCTTDQLASWQSFGPISRNVNPP